MNNLVDVTRLETLQMAPQEISIDVLLEKYAKNDETTIEEIQRRVARALASRETDPAFWEEEFFKVQNEGGFVPAGRIQSSAGTEIKATLINCFVQPVGDSCTDPVDGKPGIYTALGEAAETMRRGGGVGYDFSQIRPKNALVKGTQSNASGPVSFMNLFNASCTTVESAGARRGAQMGVLRCDHPDIMDFVFAKKTKGALNNFNVSIGVTDEFMRAVESNGKFELVHKAEPNQELKNMGAFQRADGMWVYQEVNALDIWLSVMQNTYDVAEPGILFLNKINRDNNLYYAETIEATNPCAEEPLPDYGCCCLGSMNLTKYVRNGFSKAAYFDFEAFHRDIEVAVRMLDNVLDVTYWPLPQQEKEAQNKRRIGLGFLGLGSALVMMGLRYNSDEARQWAAALSQGMRDMAYLASINLATEKGAFPLFNKKKYLAGEFIARLPEDLKKSIARKGIRNSHLLSIAPTGTITLAFADNASNGIEPAFSWVYTRKKRMRDESTKEYEVADHAWRLYRELGNDVSDDKKLPPAFVTALDMSADDHMQMLKAVQPYIDTSISKTVNVPKEYPFDDFKSLYLDAWKAGLKGLATFRPNETLGSVISTTPTETKEAAKPEIADIDPLKVQFDGRPVGDLQSVTSKVQYVTFEGKKTIYLTVSFRETEGRLGGKRVVVERPFEFFMPAGQKNDGQQWISASMRLLSMAARSGGSVAKALADMREVVWDKGTVRCGTFQKADGSEVPLHHESEAAAVGYALQRILIKRGFLDASGNQVPVHVLATANSLFCEIEEATVEGTSNDVYLPLATGDKCGDCGAYAVQKIDGCKRCVQCNWIGTCG